MNKDKDYKDYLIKVQALKDAQKATENAYINKKADYPVESLVMVDSGKDIFPAIVAGYKILFTGEVEPLFKNDITGKRIFNENFDILYKIEK